MIVPHTCEKLMELAELEHGYPHKLPAKKSVNEELIVQPERSINLAGCCYVGLRRHSLRSRASSPIVCVDESPRGHSELLWINPPPGPHDNLPG